MCCSGVGITGGTLLPGALSWLRVLWRHEVIACPGPGGNWWSGSEDHGLSTSSVCCSSVCMNGGIRHPKKRIQVTPTTAALDEEADLRLARRRVQRRFAHSAFGRRCGESLRSALRLVVPGLKGFSPILRLLRPQQEKPSGLGLAQVRAPGAQFLAGPALSRIPGSIL